MQLPFTPTQSLPPPEAQPTPPPTQLRSQIPRRGSFGSIGTSSPAGTTTSPGSSSWASVLEKQWNDGSPQIYILISTYNCIIPGGVEALLKTLNSKTLNSQHPPSSAPAPHSAPAPPPRNGFDTPIGGTMSNTPHPKSRNHWKNLSNGIIKTVQKGTQSLERQMHSMAIKADGGKNPDWKWVTLERRSSPNGMWEEVGSTEHIAISSSSHGDDQTLHCPFAIPILIEERWLQSSTFRFRVRIKSGAPMLGSKVYDLGQVLLEPRRLAITESEWVEEGLTALTGGAPCLLGPRARVRLSVVKDVRYPRCPLPGWSLTDPSKTVGGPPLGSHFPPLCQVYNKPPLVAIERAVESTVVLPVSTAVTRLLVEAAGISVSHCDGVRKLVNRRAMSFEDGFDAVANNCGDGCVQVYYMQKFPPDRFWGRVYVGVHYLPHLCVFERELGMGEVQMSHQNTEVPAMPAISLPFYPPLGVKLGRLRFEVHLEASHSMGLGMEVGTTVPPQEAVVEGFLDVELDKHEMTNVTMVDKLGKPVGVLMVMASIQGVDLQQQENAAKIRVMSAQGGLPDLMGMAPLTDASPLDATTPLPSDLRSRQLSTMGPFYSPDWMTTHTHLRQRALSNLQQRFSTYQTHLNLPNPEPKSDKRKLPSPFRPSSSKSEEPLSGIPFNVHHQSLVIQKDAREVAVSGSITCGAPSDHARGYSKSPAGDGGLRRLESHRSDVARRLTEAKSRLIGSVADYMRRYAKKHIPVNHHNLQLARGSVVELEQKLTVSTWEIALRRGNCFSQALGIALTNYLSSVTQKEKECHLEQWVRHGYLICFEGMLSAAGKEMGMIEDASTAIEMLERVGVRLLPGDVQAGRTIPVVSSDYLEWITIERYQDPQSQQHPNVTILIQVGVKKSYFESCIAPPLRYNIIQFKPVLFQMGVDIRQWGANTGANLRNQLTEQNKKLIKQASVANTNTDDLDDDDTSPSPEDFDLLTKLNYEAFRKLNAYAHAAVVTTEYLMNPPGAAAGVEGANGEEGVGTIHPHLKRLWDDVQDSKGKMQHGVLDHAAQSARILGGGHVVYCKSGKDRTCGWYSGEEG